MKDKARNARNWTNASLPVAFATALLLSTVRSIASVTSLAEVAWEMLLWGCGTIGKANVVTVSDLVSASHCSSLRLVLALLYRQHCQSLSVKAVNMRLDALE